LANLALNTIGNAVVKATFVGASPAGDLIPCPNGDTFLICNNSSVEDITITATATKACDQGEVHITDFVIPGRSNGIVVPFSSRYTGNNGYVTITYDDVQETPATGTVTFEGDVSDGDIVTIGTRVYEFDTADNPGDITAGRVRVDVSGGATASAAVTALVTAITGDTSAVVTAVAGEPDTVVVTAKDTYSGSAGNTIIFTTTGANIDVDGDGTLSNGADSLTMAAFRNTR
jgi:hypothetical protein